MKIVQFRGVFHFCTNVRTVRMSQFEKLVLLYVKVIKIFKVDYIIVELFGTNIDSLNERILTHLQMRKSSLRKIREVIREYAENLGICQKYIITDGSNS